MPKQLQRTMVAQQAMDISDIVNMSLMKTAVGEPPRRIVVKAPDGVSTEGGKKARQSITLAPAADGGPGGVVVCGWLDVAQKKAELRNHASVSAHYTERFGTELGLTQGDYEEVIEKLIKLLAGRNIEVSRSDAMPALRKAAPEPTAAQQKQGRNMTIAIASAGAILAIAMVCAALILR